MTELKRKIVTLCNESGLPIEAVLFVLRDAYRDAQEAFNVYEIQEKNKKLNNKTEEEEKNGGTAT